MGVVYLGHDGTRFAAVKTVAAHLAESPDFRARFRREVAVCALVKGPQVAQLYDADPDVETPWLAVRYVPGPTLEQVVRENGPLTGQALQAFAIAALEALRQIHAQGVTHRDLKPANVILTPMTPVLIDFGIARVADGTAITMAQQLVGSSGWMAPEVLAGEPVGPAADLFSWGALVVYAATGHTPFGSGPAEAVAYRVAHADPDVTGVEPPLSDVVQHALSRDPGRRPGAEALLGLLTGEVDARAMERVTTTIASTWPAATAMLTLSDKTPAAPSTRLGSVDSAASLARRKGRWVGAGVAVSVGLAAGLVVVLLVGVFLLLRENLSPDPRAAATSPVTAPIETTASPPSEEASPTRKARPRRVKTVTVTPTPVLGDVRGLPTGLFCLDLNERGYSYVAAIDYWRMHGQPNQMDADRNGIPCETVYPASDVAAYWGGQSLPDVPLSSGLFCRDLYARGYSYPEAVAYWSLEGAPDRMDADLNGIPCETVYSAYAVDEYWYR